MFSPTPQAEQPRLFVKTSNTAFGVVGVTGLAIWRLIRRHPNLAFVSRAIKVQIAPEHPVRLKFLLPLRHEERGIPSSREGMRRIPITIHCVCLQSDPELMQITFALDELCLSFGLGESRQQQRRQNGDDRNDDQQFDEGECVDAAPKTGVRRLSR